MNRYKKAASIQILDYIVWVTAVGVFTFRIILVTNLHIQVHGIIFQRSKSKGLIDLNYSELYPVDDSFFGRYAFYHIVLYKSS